MTVITVRRAYARFVATYVGSDPRYDVTAWGDTERLAIDALLSKMYGERMKEPGDD